MRKKIIYLILLFSLLFFLLLDPVRATKASTDGLLLWFQSLVPVLLPFFILSNLLIELDGISPLTRILHPILHRIFGCSQDGAYAIAAGFLCGYPIGAKIVADLVKSERISLEEGNYLLCFCNNVSPAFLIGYCLTERLKMPNLLVPTLFFVYGVPLLLALWMRHGRSFSSVKKAKKTSGFQISFKIVDVCMMNGLENILKLGCYIILFSMLAQLIILLPCPHPYVSYGSVGLVEITNGIRLVTASPSIPVMHQFLFVLSFAAFGGVSGAAQAESMIQGSGLSLRNYLMAKLATMLLALSCAVVFILLNS